MLLGVRSGDLGAALGVTDVRVDRGLDRGVDAAAFCVLLLAVLGLTRRLVCAVSSCPASKPKSTTRSSGACSTVRLTIPAGETWAASARVSEPAISAAMSVGCDMPPP